MAFNYEICQITQKKNPPFTRGLQLTAEIFSSMVYIPVWKKLKGSCEATNKRACEVKYTHSGVMRFLKTNLLKYV